MESLSEGWESSLQNRSLTVTTILNPPYMMIKESTNVLQKNDQYEAKFETTSFSTQTILKILTVVKSHAIFRVLFLIWWKFCHKNCILTTL